MLLSLHKCTQVTYITFANLDRNKAMRTGGSEKAARAPALGFLTYLYCAFFIFVFVFIFIFYPVFVPGLAQSGRDVPAGSSFPVDEAYVQRRCATEVEKGYDSYQHLKRRYVHTAYIHNTRYIHSTMVYCVICHVDVLMGGYVCNESLRTPMLRGISVGRCNWAGSDSYEVTRSEKRHSRSGSPPSRQCARAVKNSLHLKERPCIS